MVNFQSFFKVSLVNMKREKMNQNNQKNGVCDLIVESTNSLKSSDLIGYSIYNGCYSSLGSNLPLI